MKIHKKSMFAKIPNDVFKIVAEFAWKCAVSRDEILKDIRFLQDVHNSIPHDLLSVVCYSSTLNRFVPSPFLDYYPFYPLKYIKSDTIFSGKMIYIPDFLNATYYSNRYKACLVKKFTLLNETGFSLYNKLYFNVLQKLKPTDFDKEHIHMFEFIRRLSPLRAF